MDFTDWNFTINRIPRDWANDGMYVDWNDRHLSIFYPGTTEIIQRFDQGEHLELRDILDEIDVDFNEDIEDVFHIPGSKVELVRRTLIARGFKEVRAVTSSEESEDPEFEDRTWNEQKVAAFAGWGYKLYTDDPFWTKPPVAIEFFPPGETQSTVVFDTAQEAAIQRLPFDKEFRFGQLQMADTYPSQIDWYLRSYGLIPLNRPQSACETVDTLIADL